MERRDSLTKEEKNRNAQRRQSMLAVTDIAKMNKTKMWVFSKKEPKKFWNLYIHWNILVVVIRSIQRRKEEVSTCMFVIIRDPHTVRNRSILVRGSLKIIFYAETYSENLYVYQISSQTQLLSFSIICCGCQNGRWSRKMVQKVNFLSRFRALCIVQSASITVE